MMQKGTLHSHEVTLPLRPATGLLSARELLLVVAAGIASAVIGHFGGRAVHALWPIPMSGSIAVALPRAIILLAVLLRVDRFGALTTAGVAEVGAKLALGGGLSPWFLVVPVLGNLAGDVLWASLRSSTGRRARLVLTGGGLCGARVLGAMVFWGLLGWGLHRSADRTGALLVCIVGINVVLGMVGGLVVSGPLRRARAGRNR